MLMCGLSLLQLTTILFRFIWKRFSQQPFMLRIFDIVIIILGYMSFKHRLDSIINDCLLFSEFPAYILCFGLNDCVSSFCPLQHVGASEGMTELEVQDMTVSEPKITIFKPLFPTSAQVATAVIQNTNDFKRTVYCLCIKS